MLSQEARSSLEQEALAGLFVSLFEAPYSCSKYAQPIRTKDAAAALRANIALSEKASAKYPEIGVTTISESPQSAVNMESALPL